MILKAPKFWNEKNALSSALSPLSYLYWLGHSFHQKGKTAYRASIPVLCVGNAVVGGSGKTPTVLALIDVLKEQELCKNPFVLTRGYGGSIQSPVQVDPQNHNTAQVGDEALLLARKAPVIKSADRAAGAKMAEELGADMILMDDGLQNPTLHQDIKVLVVDSVFGFGNERLLPAGPLRAPLRQTLESVDLIITIGKRTDHVSMFSLDETAPTIWAYLDSDEQLDAVKPYIGFAGIGRPEKFEKSLKDMNANIAAFHPFADHHPYSAYDMEKLRRDAQKHKAQLITTEKDFVRIPSAYHKYVEVLPVNLIFEEREELTLFLNQKLGVQ
ncbi:MAG: tetraacyldisaccharide 4'-kinase [Pseudomonadota bacterium]